MFKHIGCTWVSPKVEKLTESFNKKLTENNNRNNTTYSNLDSESLSNLISIWQAENNTSNLPTEQDLIDQYKKESWEGIKIYLATPIYNMMGNQSFENSQHYNNEPLIKIEKNGNILLNKLTGTFEENLMSFKNYLNDKINSGKSNDEINQLIQEINNVKTNKNSTITDLFENTNDIYRFLLWMGMSYNKQIDITDNNSGNNYKTNSQIRTKMDTAAISDAIKKMQKYRELYPIQNNQTIQQQTNTQVNRVDNNVVPFIGDILKVDSNNIFAQLSQDMNPIKRHDRVMLISKNFSDKVDEFLMNVLNNLDTELANARSKNDLNKVKELEEKKDLYLDPVKGRQEILNSKGSTPNDIFKSMLDEYKEVVNDESEDEYVRNEFELITKYFKPLLEEACIYIEASENMRLVLDNKVDNLNATVEKSVSEEEIEEKEFEEEHAEERVNGSEGWSFKARFTNPQTSMSKDVKNVLANLTRGDEDDLGRLRYINPEYAHSVLINEMCKIASPDEFCDDFNLKEIDENFQLYALEKMKHKYPWAQQIIDKLKEEPRLISKFYADLRKDFISYWTQKDGKSIPLNQSVALDSTLTDILQNYEQGTMLSKNSIYNKVGKLNIENATNNITIVDNILSNLDDDLDELEEDEIKDIIENSTDMFRALGINTNFNTIEDLLNSDKSVLQNTLNTAKDIFTGISNLEINGNELNEDSNLIDSFQEYYNIIANNVGEVGELNNIQSFMQNGKTYYSYSAPNYIDTIIKNLKDENKHVDFCKKEFEKYEWFYKNGEYRNEWLRLLNQSEQNGGANIRRNFEFKDVNSLDGEEYTKWSPTQIKNDFILEYFSVSNNEKGINYAWYNMPIFSDSPVVKFIKFVKYETTNENDTFKDKLIPLFNKLVKQEIDRINLVNKRKALIAKGEASEINQFDKNGNKFLFIPELNEYTVEGISFLNSLQNKNAKEQDDIINKAIEDVMKNKFDKFMNENSSKFNNLKDIMFSQGLLLGSKENESGIKAIDNSFKSRMEEYLWNSTFATSQMIQIATTDIAYYKDVVDFQKRFKEIYAAGTKLNTNSYYGRKTERSIYLVDQIVTSRRYDNIKKLVDKAVEEKRLKNFDRENILAAFKDINLADAQAYRCLSSYRAILDMIGDWTPKMQEAFERLQNNKWDMADFNIVWQTLKPFMFTQIGKESGIKDKAGNDLNIKVPHQNKNSEFLLLAMYDIMNASTNSPKMKAINKFMEDNDIDVSQFQSAVKAGMQGCIDISYSRKALSNIMNSDIWKSIDNAAKKALGDNVHYKKTSDIQKFKIGNDTLLDEGKISQEEYNRRFDEIEPTEEEVIDILESCSKNEDGTFNLNVVHELPYRDYMIAMPTPEHLFDHEAVFGSQFRNLIISDMPETNPDGTPFKIKVNDKEYTKKELLDLYNSLVVENLLEDFENVRKEFEDEYDENHNLKELGIEKIQRMLLNQIKSNSKYGRDMVNALQIVDHVNPKTGRLEKTFNIPLHNPSTTIQLQELFLSVFKNHITKQHIKGGACILVSNHGYTKELEILYNGDGSIKGIQCYLPAYSKKFYDPFMVEKTSSDGVKYKELDVNKLPDDLKKLIGYRIPTENKYSMAPLIIKGFLPQENGSCIMYPAELMKMSGEDCDVDKKFLMLPEFDVFKYDMQKASNDYFKSTKDILDNKVVWEDIYETYPQVKETAINARQESYKDWLNQGNTGSLEEYVKLVNKPKLLDWLTNAQDVFKKALGLWGKDDYIIKEGEKNDFKVWFKENKEKYRYAQPVIKKVKYDTKKGPEEQTRAARNNMLIDISYNILCNKDTVAKMHNPGNFDVLKKNERISTIISSKELVETYMNTKNIESKDLYKTLYNESLDDLNDFLKEHKVSRDPLSLDTFIYFHKQNMTGGALIGMYANNTTLQAKFQVSNIRLIKPITINGRNIQNLCDIKTSDGDLISSNCAQFSAASVDNVKDPVLAGLMQNTKTANITAFMLRAGMSIEEIALFFSQPLIKSMAESGTLKSKDITKLIEMLEEHFGSSAKPITSELLLNTCVKSHYENDWSYVDENDITQYTQEMFDYMGDVIRILYTFRNIVINSENLRPLTKISRADSPNGAIANNLGKAQMQLRNVDVYHNMTNLDINPKFTITGFDDMVSNYYDNEDDNTKAPITAYSSKNELRNFFMNKKMPMLQAFHTLGIQFGYDLSSTYFDQVNQFTDKLIKDLQTLTEKGIFVEGFGREGTTINGIYNQLVQFSLTKTKLFGDDDTMTYEAKRKWYLDEFPKIFKDYIVNNKDIASLNVIKKLSVTDKNELILNRSGRITPILKEALMRDFDTLLYLDNPKAQELAIHLFRYAFYKNGLSFGPNSYSNFFSTNFLNSFPEYVDNLRNMKYYLNDNTYFKEFKEQYLLNNAYKILPRCEIFENQPNGSIAVQRSYFTSKFNGKPFKMIFVNNSVYSLSVEGSKSLYYTKSFDTELLKQVRYNANANVNTLIENMNIYKANADSFNNANSNEFVSDEEYNNDEDPTETFSDISEAFSTKTDNLEIINTNGLQEAIDAEEDKAGKLAEKIENGLKETAKKLGIPYDKLFNKIDEAVDQINKSC